MINYIRVGSIKIVQYFLALVKIEDGIWTGLGKYCMFVFGTHGNSEPTGNINKCQYVGNGIWVVENF